jgi:hypothetical protein
MALKTFLFPSIGSNKPKNLSHITNIASEFNVMLNKYCQEQGITDPQGIKLPGLNDALKSVKRYKEEVAGTSNELAVRGGITDKGHLALTFGGIVPRKGKGVKIDDEVIIRKDFASLVEELRNQSNVVVNLQKGDGVIDKAAERQAKKFGTGVEEPDDVDFSGITTGNVILAAHGSRTEVNGMIIGTKLGKRTPAEIVGLLTEGDDKKKRLSPDFSGTVWLSGCFTASGGIAPPGEDFDHESFARSVWELLKSKGYKKATVKGQPGIARTDEQGNKSSVTPTGQKDYDKLKKELAQLQKEIKDLAAELDKLKKAHPDEEERRSNPAYVKQLMLLNELKKQATQINAEKESHVIQALVATYGLKVR